MKRVNLLAIRALAPVLIFLLSACAEEPLDGGDKKGEGQTITLRLAATVVPIPETKATIQPTRPGSEAEAAGFYYEMVSSDAEETGFNYEIKSAIPDSILLPLATKAPAALKNVYALLFTSNGAFNGRSNMKTFTVGTATDITFTNVVTPTATNCRLVMVANDNAAATPYASTGGKGDFASFTGTYADFQKLTLSSAVNQDTDVPYAGSATVNLSLGETGVTVEIPLYRTLAKITLNNNTFNITGGPARSGITLYNAGERRFATPGNDNYDGTGSTETSTFVATTDGGNTNSTTWYVGENIRPAGSNIKTTADRNSTNAPKEACYIRIASTVLSIPANTSPKIGEECIVQPGTKALTYDIYLGKSSVLSDFSLRRHTNYTISTEISGTLIGQEYLAATDGRVTLTKTRCEPAGLAIGRFGGPSGYTAGTGSHTTIAGSYEKMLLLEPNTSRTTETDGVMKIWGTEGVKYQTETRKYWDRTYIYGITTGGTVGGMNKDAGGVYDYCYQLTLGGVAKGTWYVPSLSQLETIWTVYEGLKRTGRYHYTAFNPDHYWSSTEESSTLVWFHDFAYGTANAHLLDNKQKALNVRCVRDSPVSGATGYVTVQNGYPVVDLSELDPLGCVLTNTEAAARRKEINGYTPSNEIMVTNSSSLGFSNAKMPSKFQVMRINHSIGMVDWAAAYTACKEYASEGGTAGEWRLPSQREFQMIWVLHPQLLGKGDFTAFSDSYWTFTEYDAIHAWSADIYNGCIHYRPKKDLYGVRCIRDLL